MIDMICLGTRKLSGCAPGILLVAMLAAAPAIATSEILWTGDFSTGDYTQWGSPGDLSRPHFGSVPDYGRPKYPPDGKTRYPGVDPAYFGNGELMELVTSPTRGASKYSNRVMLKNRSNTSEPEDCDNGVCYRRANYLNTHLTWKSTGEVMPDRSERWFSASFFVPSDWDNSKNLGGSWGIHVLEIKSGYANNAGGPMHLSIKDGHWRLEMRWNPNKPPQTKNQEWYWSMFFAGDEKGSGPYPRTAAVTGIDDFWADGTKFFPDEATSHAALRRLNRGGWTDWVFHVRWDGRKASEGGKGFFRAWKREDDGPWIHVLNMYASKTSRGGDSPTFEHGIGWDIPGYGYGVILGMYSDREQVLRSKNNRVIYTANVKVGDKNATFADMSPDGSRPGSSGTKPKPPPLSLED